MCFIYLAIRSSKTIQYKNWEDNNHNPISYKLTKNELPKIPNIKNAYELQLPQLEPIPQNEYDDIVNDKITDWNLRNQNEIDLIDSLNESVSTIDCNADVHQQQPIHSKHVETPERCHYYQPTNEIDDINTGMVSHMIPMRSRRIPVRQTDIAAVPDKTESVSTKAKSVSPKAESVCSEKSTVTTMSRFEQLRQKRLNLDSAVGKPETKKPEPEILVPAGYALNELHTILMNKPVEKVNKTARSSVNSDQSLKHEKNRQNYEQLPKLHNSKMHQVEENEKW